MPRSRESKPPRRPRVCTPRLVLVSLVVGIVLAVVRVPVGVALEGTPWFAATRSTQIESVLLGDRLIGIASDGGPAAGVQVVQQWNNRAEAFRNRLLEAGDAVMADRDPRPPRFRSWLDQHGGVVYVVSAGWPLRAAEGQYRESPGVIDARESGLWRVRALGSDLPVPCLPLWPGLFGNTLFYGALALAPVAFVRWRTLRRRAGAYELGEGIGAGPECGLARAISG